MRDRTRTPFFFIPGADESTDPGEESPARPVEGRALVGHVVGDRFLLREKTGHSADSVHYSAHDMLGNLDVDLELYPDGTLADGYRLGTPNAAKQRNPLPNLYKAEPAQVEGQPPQVPRSSWARRIWILLTHGRGRDERH